jgi:signal transduction histidine kinase/ActR/RegA family two-component response regulator
MSQMIECAAILRRLGQRAGSLEEVATRIVAHLYEQFVVPESGSRCLALVRLFKTTALEDLEPDLQRFALHLLGEQTAAPGLRCLTLFGTRGDRPEWNARRRSAGHQAIPLPSASVVERLPMVSQVIKQLGLDATSVVRPRPEVLVHPSEKRFSVFYVPDAAESPFVPALNDFVRPAGIRSVVGLGGMLPRGDLYVVILFSKIEISRVVAERFSGLALQVQQALLPFESGPLFAAPTAKKQKRSQLRQPSLVQEIAKQKQHLEALEELLAVNEQVALEQARAQEAMLLELREATRVAEEASRAKNAFLATMSHEIRTPMTGIVGTADLLGETSLTPEQRELIDLVRSSSATLLTIINDSLDYAKIEAGHLSLDLQPFDLPHLVEEIARLFQGRAIKEGLSLSLDASPALPREVIGDPLRLRQVLWNILSNAIKFTQAGSIRIRAAPTPRAAQPDRVRFEVEDTGIGIPEHEIPRIFENFTQVDMSSTRRFTGTGLGLAISRRLVALMGGEIGATSRVGEGSTFWFEIPLPTEEREEEPEEIAIAKSAEVSSPSGDDVEQPLSQYRVLVVEDDEMVRNVLLRMLARLGPRTDVARNGREAVRAFQARPYDLVLMDCHMPEMDGFQACAEMRAGERAGHRTPIVALTGVASQTNRERCLEAGMDDHVAKPVKLHQLSELLEHWLLGAHGEQH